MSISFTGSSNCLNPRLSGMSSQSGYLGSRQETRISFSDRNCSRMRVSESFWATRKTWMTVMSFCATLASISAYSLQRPARCFRYVSRRALLATILASYCSTCAIRWARSFRSSSSVVPREYQVASALPLSMAALAFWQFLSATRQASSRLSIESSSRCSTWQSFAALVLRSLLLREASIAKARMGSATFVSSSLARSVL
mmetsp:Transcript_7113/g.17339  ORF Transcript_7113/g.17339 Transcript_7113/m.17339 type:complete len:200 (-) Transcript_7113:543-1142(-)